MKKITSITSQKKGDRLNIFLDGEFAFGVKYETAVKFGLKAESMLSDDDIKKIEREEGLSSAYERALNYAVKKVVSAKQMNDYLLRNGFSVSSTEIAIKKLVEYGYIDDRAYAKAYANSYGGERGSLRLKMKLRQAGISDEIIDEALANRSDESSINTCIDKYLRTHKDVDKQKLIRYLAYRGFDYDTINENISGRDL